MRCPSITGEDPAKLLDYAAGRLDRKSTSILEAHVSECQTCSKFVASQENLWNVLDEWDAEHVSFGFDRMLYARIEQAKEQSLVRRFTIAAADWLSRPAVPLAATVALLLLGFVVYTFDWVHEGVLPEGPSKSIHSPAIKPVDADQLNRAIDDLQLLHQLDDGKDEAAASSAM